MFALNPVDVGSGGQYDQNPTLFEAMASKWRLGGGPDSMTGAFWDSYDNYLNKPNNLMVQAFGATPEEDNQPLVPPDILNKKFGLPGLQFVKPEREFVAAQRSAKHQELMTDLSIAEKAPVFGSWVGAPSFAAGMLSSMVRPLDFAATFLLPGVGGEIGMLGRSATATERIAFGTATVEGKTATGFFSKASRFAPIAERGIIPRTAIPLVEQFPKAAPAVVNNLVQQAIIEVPTKIREYQETGNIDLSSSVINMAAGAVFAEGIRMVGHFVEKAGDKFFKSAMERASSDIQAGRPVDVSQEVAVHSAPIEAENRALREERAPVEQTIQQNIDTLVGASTAAPVESVATIKPAPDIADMVGPAEELARKNGRITRKMLQSERRIGYERAQAVIRDLEERGVIDSAGYVVSKRPIPDVIKAAVEKEVQARIPEVARADGVDHIAAERRARNKVSTELGKIVSVLLHDFQSEGHLGHATAEAAQVIAESILKVGALPKEVAAPLQNHLHGISELKKGNTAYAAEGKTLEATAYDRAKKMGELIGVKVVKETATLPTGSTLARIPKPEEGSLLGIADAFLATQHEQLAKLGDAAIGRAERIKSHLDRVVQERVDYLKRQNQATRVENGRVVTEADLKARNEMLEATKPDMKAIEETEAKLSDPNSIMAAVNEFKKELGDLTPQEQARIEAVTKSFEESENTDLLGDATDCIIKHG